MSTIKINRALRLSTIGRCPGSAQAMLAAIPREVIAAITARDLGALLDANWQLAQASKQIADRDACDNGVVWDGREKRLRALAA